MEHTGNKTENTKATALITAVHRERYEILVEQETSDTKLNARLKTGVYYQDKGGEAFPTVGDRVRIQTNRCGDALILETLPRTSVFYRENPTPGMECQAVAANFDYVFLVMSMNHDFNQNRLDRYLTAAWESRATPVVILTKKDLCEEPEYYVNLVERQAQGVAVCAVSAVMGEGMEHVQRYLGAGKTVVLLGSSGVGKSTFVNALCGETVMDTGAIREDDSKGRHTTTYRQMILLPDGSRVIDTPGMRVLGVGDAKCGMDTTFSDIEELAQLADSETADMKKRRGVRCRRQCGTEDCRNARLLNYKKLLAEAAHAKRREETARKKQLRSVERKKNPVRKKQYKAE